jgi:hypothetical protein
MKKEIDEKIKRHRPDHTLWQWSRGRIMCSCDMCNRQSDNQKVNHKTVTNFPIDMGHVSLSGTRRGI